MRADKSRMGNGKAYLMAVFLIAVGFFLSASSRPVEASEVPPLVEKTVLLVLMPGTALVHIIEMPSMDRCKEAAEFTPSAQCVEAAKIGSDVDPTALTDFAPASGPADVGEPNPDLTYKPLD